MNETQIKETVTTMRDEMVAIKDYVQTKADELNSMADTPSAAGYELGIAAKKMTSAVDALKDVLAQL